VGGADRFGVDIGFGLKVRLDGQDGRSCAVCYLVMARDGTRCIWNQESRYFWSSDFL
jgi:hypothetical protein